MITMTGREDSAVETAEGLARAGVDTEIFIQPPDWPVGGVGNNQNSRRALSWAIENLPESAVGVLFVEDDIVIKPDRFERALRSAEEVGELMYFYMHDIQPRTDWYQSEDWIKRMMGPATRRGVPYSTDMSDVVVPEGPREMKPEARMYGSQCVYIPKPYIKFLYSFMNTSEVYTSKVRSRPSHAIDTSLNLWRMENKLPVYCYLPHPVQHLQNRTRRQGTRLDVYSKSFDLVSDLEVADG